MVVAVLRRIRRTVEQRDVCAARLRLPFLQLYVSICPTVPDSRPPLNKLIFPESCFISADQKMGDGFGGGDSSAQQTRGSYWKRGDSMRLIHLLTDPELKVADANMRMRCVFFFFERR